ncbi:MAG: GTPase Era [Betaproteobacteria bacterium]|nr:MAG: GTPase Era [Betaproteobacteria bacterium]
MVERTATTHRAGHIAIVGRPSVGKSTLVNSLVGEKISITSKKPQTTRYRITGILSEPERQFAFVDTPGFQTRNRGALNDRLNRTVRDSLGGVDVVVWVVDARHLTSADRAVAALLPSGIPVIVAVNKIDQLKDKAVLLPMLSEIALLRDFAAIVPISAERGMQLTDLKDEITKLLPLSPLLYPESDVTDRNERFLAAELIREKIFRLLGEEVPYATTVAIESFEERGDLRRIHATVYVDKANQRAILVGAAGARMKAVASQARAEMERVFGGTVYLEVWVKVKRGWANDETQLTRFGY